MRLVDVIKPALRSRIKKGTIPNFMPRLDSNKKYQAAIWDDKTYQVNPSSHVFTTIQEHFGNRLIRQLEFPENAVVVDIGCFIGEKLWQLQRTRPYLGIGVDIAISSLVAAQKIDIYDHKFIAADMENLPFKDNSVDFVTVFDVIEHLSNAQKGFSEVARILKPSGQFLLHIPISDNTWSLFWWKQQLFPNSAQKDYLDVGHAPERMLSRSQIRNYMGRNNLEVTREIPYNSFFVHFWDREFARITGWVLTSLFRGGQPKSTGARSMHTGNLGTARAVYGKYIVPILEFISFPDQIFSSLGIGNTCFFLAKKL